LKNILIATKKEKKAKSIINTFPSINCASTAPNKEPNKIVYFHLLSKLISTHDLFLCSITGLHIEDRPQYSIGFISIIPFFLITLGTYVSVPMGVKIMHNFKNMLIKRFFCLLLLISALKMLRDLTV